MRIISKFTNIPDGAITVLSPIEAVLVALPDGRMEVAFVEEGTNDSICSFDFKGLKEIFKILKESNLDSHI